LVRASRMCPTAYMPAGPVPTTAIRKGLDMFILRRKNQAVVWPPSTGNTAPVT
jgi:hypothetical protein